MIYVYFDSKDKIAYVCNKPLFTTRGSDNVSSGGDIYHFEDVEAVSSDKDRGQVLIHGHMGKGIIAEYPISRTVLSCVLPIE